MNNDSSTSDVDHLEVPATNQSHQNSLTPKSSAVTDASSFYEFGNNKVDKQFTGLPQLKELNDLLSQFGFDDLNNPIQNVKISKNTLSKFANHKQNVYTDYDFILENQRGFTFFGIPLFSEKTLLPTLDPPNFQSLKGHDLLLTNLNSLPLPDFDWNWDWPKWYILMLNDVDDQGWIYSRMFFKSRNWKGKYNFGNFIRRRVWCRKRVKVCCDEDNCNQSHANNDMEDSGNEILVGMDENMKKGRFHSFIRNVI